MNKEEFELILKEGEGYFVEFKEKISSLDEEIVAFANAGGGKIFLGVDDNGVVKGININNKLKSQITDIARNCDPQLKVEISTFDYPEKNVLIINVPESKNKPHKCREGFFLRIDANSQKLKRDEIIDLFKSEGKVRFDELIESKFNYSEDFDRDKFFRFLELAALSKSVGQEKILINFGIAEEQQGKLYLNNAGVLFFAKEPQRFVPWSVFTVVLFKDYEGVDIIDRKEIKGSLFEIVEQTMDFVKLYTKVAYRFTGKPQRENIYEYPFDAIREAVINSVMHKYYFEQGHNDILRFFPDRIRIENYWVKPKNFKIGETVFRRNPLIADLFTRIHFGEKLGTGFERIKEICKKENAPFPEIKFNENYFYITFKQSYEYLKIAGSAETTQKTPQKTPQKILTGLENKILNEIAKNSRISRREIANILKISPDTVKEYLEKLKKKEVIKRVGPDRGGYWEVR